MSDRRLLLRGLVPALLLVLDAGGAKGETSGMLDLTRAVVVAPEGLSPRERKAATMLVEEVERHTGVRWEVRPKRAVSGLVIVVGREASLRGQGASIDRALGLHAAPEGKEGYRIETDGGSGTIAIVGNDERGVLFGVGRLLRELRMSRGRVRLPEGFQIATAPQVALRGHQLGYRPKTHSYDAWDLSHWEQYIRDLAIFGTNAIELVPPRTDDDADSPHFPKPPLEIMVGMSRIADEYGLDVWIWYPALDKDYSDPATVEFALKEWGEVFKRLPRIDAILVPGGDPGKTQPKFLMSLMERQAESLRHLHPKAGMWISPQGFTPEWFDEFLGIVRKEPAWLTGVVFGPQVRLTLPELRKAIPARYPIRHYPDITHSLSCQYPVPDWDTAYSVTHERESINPRPTDQAAILRHTNRHTIGFLTYSEGCNDDVNKFVWSGLGWNLETPVEEILRQFGRVFIGEDQAEGFAQGLLALESNWQGPLLTNSGVETTLRQFQDLERSAPPSLLLNWRFQQALFRAYYDAYVRDRLIRETALEMEAMEVLRSARRFGSLKAMERAEAILDRAVFEPVSVDRRTRIHELAAALYQSIRMQLDVERYNGIEVGRGTPLSTVELPLNNRKWLLAQFEVIRKVAAEADRLAGIAGLCNRTDPGPGGFYDDLGDLTRQPHLVRGPVSYQDDPDLRHSVSVGFDDQPGWPLAWLNTAQTLYATPLRMHYEKLDPHAKYRVKVVYGGDNFRPKIRLDAEGREIHPLIAKPLPPRALEFDVPASATSDGTLDLSWTQEPGRGGNGRGCQVAEVWLIRKPD